VESIRIVETLNKIHPQGIQSGHIGKLISVIYVLEQVFYVNLMVMSIL
jgi:hypothetical protein